MKNKLIVFLIRLFDKKLAEKVKGILTGDIKLYKDIDYSRIKEPLKLLDTRTFKEQFNEQKLVAKTLGKLFDDKINSMTDEEWLDSDPIFVSKVHFKDHFDDLGTPVNMSYRGLVFFTEDYKIPDSIDSAKKISEGLRNIRNRIISCSNYKSLTPGVSLTGNEIPTLLRMPGSKVI